MIQLITRKHTKVTLKLKDMRTGEEERKRGERKRRTFGSELVARELSSRFVRLAMNHVSVEREVNGELVDARRLLERSLLVNKSNMTSLPVKVTLLKWCVP